MSQSSENGQDLSTLQNRSFINRRPVTASFLLVIGILIALAAIIFSVNDPLAQKATNTTMVGGMIVVVVLMLVAVGVSALIINFLIWVKVSL